MCFYWLFSFLRLGLALSSYVTEVLKKQEPFLKGNQAGIEVSRAGVLKNTAEFWNCMMVFT